MYELCSNGHSSVLGHACLLSYIQKVKLIILPQQDSIRSIRLTITLLQEKSMFNKAIARRKSNRLSLAGQNPLLYIKYQKLTLRLI